MFMIALFLLIVNVVMKFPKSLPKIHVHFTITGKALSEKRIKRAIELSADKYCSASLMLAKTAEITHDYEIINVN